MAKLKDMPLKVQKELRDYLNREIYKQGGEGRLAYTLPPHLSFLTTKKLYGVGLSMAITHGKDGFFTPYLPKEEFVTISKKLIDLDIDKIERAWKKDLAKMLKKVDSIISMDLGKLSVEELLKLFKEVCDIGEVQWRHLIFIDFFDIDGDSVIEDAVREYDAKLVKELPTLIFPTALSQIQQEKVSLLQIKKHNGDRKMLKKHQHTFYGIRNNYFHIVYLKEDDFLKEMESLDEKEIEAIENSFREESEKRDRLIKNMPASLKKKLYLFQKMTELRDRRKMNHGMLMVGMKKLLEEISRKTKISMDLLEYLAYGENPIGMEKELKERSQGVVAVAAKEGFYFITGKDAENIHKTVEDRLLVEGELKGKVAMAGKAKGVVRIMNKVSDFSRFNDGDILVTSMTRPEFVPIMEKAAGIITDEGGITSHAAIVSRELKVPCIIGTQSATQVLKDGDMVEVDAENGIVRKL